jgi:hypothetical protein
LGHPRFAPGSFVATNPNLLVQSSNPVRIPIPLRLLPCSDSTFFTGYLGLKLTISMIFQTENHIRGPVRFSPKDIAVWLGFWARQDLIDRSRSKGKAFFIHPPALRWWSRFEGLNTLWSRFR